MKDEIVMLRESNIEMVNLITNQPNTFPASPIVPTSQSSSMLPSSVPMLNNTSRTN